MVKSIIDKDSFVLKCFFQPEDVSKNCCPFGLVRRGLDIPEEYTDYSGVIFKCFELGMPGSYGNNILKCYRDEYANDHTGGNSGPFHMLQ